MRRVPARAKTRPMTTPLITTPITSQTTAAPERLHPLSSAPPPRPARDVVTYVGLVASMVVGLAFVLRGAGDLAPMLSMTTPLVAVCAITLFRTPQGARRALWGTFGLRSAGWRSWPAAGLISVLAVFVVPFGAAGLLGSAGVVPLSEINIPTALFRLVLGLSTMTVIALTEEIGWRSYLLPRMQMVLPRRRAALAVGFLHGLFHLPLILLTSTYDSVGSRWVVAPMVVLSLTASGVFYAWLKDRSGSVWPVAFAHATVNVFVDGLGLVVAVAPVTLAYTATESGVVTFACVATVAALLLARGRTWRAPRASTGR